MHDRMKHFVAGGAGVLAFEIALFARHPEAVQHHLDRFGVPGIAVAASALVLLAALTGLLVMLFRPRNTLLALFGGVIPPAILVAAGLPKYGTEAPVTPSGRVLILKPKPAEALWLPVSPVRHVADATTAAIRSREARVVAEAVADAEQRAGTFERAAVAAAITKTRATAVGEHTAAVAALREQLAADRATALRAVQEQHTGHLAKLEAELTHERESTRIAVEARHTAEAALATKRTRIAAISAQGPGSEALQAAVVKLRGELELAADRRAQITQQREDYRTLVEWYFTDVPADGARPFKILSKRLASKESVDRVVAARLMVLCGPSAKPLLRRALADRDEQVREAVETSLVVLDR